LALERDAEALRNCTEGRTRFPDEPVFHDCHLILLAWSNVTQPDADSAWHTMDLELAAYPASLRPMLEPRLRALVAAVLARGGLADSARTVVTAAKDDDTGTVGVALPAAGVFGLLGDSGDALKEVQWVLQTHPEMRATLRAAPELRRLLADTAFIALLGPEAPGSS
jgi:hypothetical protein